jgi:hypothetical protein
MQGLQIQIVTDIVWAVQMLWAGTFLSRTIENGSADGLGGNGDSVVVVVVSGAADCSGAADGLGSADGLGGKGESGALVAGSGGTDCLGCADALGGKGDPSELVACLGGTDCSGGWYRLFGQCRWLGLGQWFRCGGEWFGRGNLGEVVAGSGAVDCSGAADGSGSADGLGGKGHPGALVAGSGGTDCLGCADDLGGNLSIGANRKVGADGSTFLLRPIERWVQMVQTV